LESLFNTNADANYRDTELISHVDNIKEQQNVTVNDIK